jgi:hypothetical protein
MLELQASTNPTIDILSPFGTLLIKGTDGGDDESESEEETIDIASGRGYSRSGGDPPVTICPDLTGIFKRGTCTVKRQVALLGLCLLTLSLDGHCLWRTSWGQLCL